MLSTYYTALVVIQLLHSQEEIFTHFEKRWPVWKMSRVVFVTFEILFSIFIILPIFFVSFPYRIEWMLLFNLLMFANGVWHLMWFACEKRYVPGLVTAFLFLIAFAMFYFSSLL